MNQGKVVQAVAEYQQILKHEPRDQVTLMTVGELYIRQGETFQAIDYFERLAQIFVSDGFLTKAIAVYKRIAKLAPEEIRPLEKLADLYVQHIFLIHHGCFEGRMPPNRAHWPGHRPPSLSPRFQRPQ